MIYIFQIFIGNNRKAFCGAIPSYFLNEVQNVLQNMLKESPDLFKTSDLATKAYQKYTKTRSSASKASVKNSHQIETQKPHPIFQDQDAANKETQNVLEALRSFKPKESALSIYKNKAVKQGHLKVEEVVGLNDAISNMKNIEKIQKQEKERKQKIKEDQEKLQNMINQKFLQIEKSKQQENQEQIQKQMDEQIEQEDEQQNENEIEEDDLDIQDDEMDLNEEEYEQLQKQNKEDQENIDKKVEENEEKSEEKKEEDLQKENDENEEAKVKTDEEIMRGMTKKQKKKYIKEQAELRRQDPKKYQEEQKLKQQALKQQKEKAKEQKLQEQQKQKEAKESLNQKRKGDANNITSFIEEYQQKLNQQSEQYKVEMPDMGPKKKRKEISDFKHPTQYISGSRDVNHINQFELESQIQQGDVQQFIIGEDPHEILAKQKRNVWDPVKKRYVMGQAPGQKDKKAQQDKEDSKHKNKDMGKKIYEKWQKKNQIRLQKDGELEDQEIMQKAQSSFKQRSLSNKGYRFTKEAPKNIKSELKNEQQILKDKKKSRQLKLKNMEKGKRTQIQNRQKQQKAELLKRRQSQSGGPRGRSSRGGSRGGSRGASRGRGGSRR
ncbi:hypothetical protein PPERSA_06580 [Pseudocohnilembus persalinus]|uniref:RNA helicase n=1 Tax=Pseudocohnilembus persalinus TaxID=266149 RepID=A0A0V0QRK8_PSEPJ|nr:hypothetical protein PPERSA_06580 [Pseudocohnilembus persalinus]|eukprot:KRX04946.1 hypothetical protein PPERSA_06580 [Pseudocohnilembus persalinus]